MRTKKHLNQFRGFALLLLLCCNESVWSQTFVGVRTAPADNNTQAGPTRDITPVAGMQAGDLVVLFSQYRGENATLTISITGGQNWNAEDGHTQSGFTQTARIFWCRYNGTWAANPEVTAGIGNNQALTVAMYVFRPANTNSVWGLNAPTVHSTSTTSPSTITGFTTALPNAVVMAFWNSATSSSWGTLTGTGWTKTGLSAQIRNTSTSGQSHSAAYRIITGANTATNNPAQTLTPSANTLRSITAFYEIRPANILLGKSFINISKPNGGTVTPGDQLEIRVSMFISNPPTLSQSRLYRMRFNDTIPNGLSYVTNSMRLLTNEGKQVAAYSDAPGDDFGVYNSITKTLRVNLGRDTVQSGVNIMPVGNVSTTSIDTAQGGGFYNATFHRPRAGSGMLVIIAYRVMVEALPFNAIVNYGPGAIRYRYNLSSYSADDQVSAPNGLSFIIYPNYGLCANATGSNSISAGNGNFGAGIDHNGPSPGPNVPGYGFNNITTGNPNDGNYAVVKNLSPSQSTNMYVDRPDPANTHRVFRVWDIIGDHTGAADPLAGNPPPANGQAGGYMLAVNAAYQLSIANNQTISGLCENTFYEFSAWFRNVCKRCGADSAGRGASGTIVNAAYIPTAPGDSSGVKPNLTFMIDGIDYYNSGDMDYVGQWGQWVKKGFVFKTNPGQTSLTISIKNNAPGGGGNDWVMDDISFATCLPQLQFFPTQATQLCLNQQISVSSVVNTFFDNYKYYQWERSTDNGSTWHTAPLKPAVDSFSFAFNGTTYEDAVYYPQFVTNASQNGHRYRLRVATTIPNLANGNCNIYQADEIVTMNIGTCDVLPAELRNFRGRLQNMHGVLSWETLWERNNAWFEIERSMDGVHYISIGKVTSINPNGTQTQLYSFTDPEELSGRAFYRLRMVAFDQQSRYSSVVMLQNQQDDRFEIKSVVNPFKSQVWVDLIAPRQEPVQMQLLDTYGRVLLQQQQQLSGGLNSIRLNQVDQLQRGNYILLVRTSQGNLQRLILKQ